MARTDEDILKIAEDYNVGDLNLGYTLKTRGGAQRLINATALRNNVLPGRIVNKAHPECNYVFTWCPIDDAADSRNYVHDCKEEGYKVVSESEWVLNNDSWEWWVPERWKYRWSVTNLLMNQHDEFLMYKDEDAWRRQKAGREAFHDDSIAGRSEAAVEQAARVSRDAGISGVEIDATTAGKETAKVKTTKRGIFG